MTVTKHGRPVAKVVPVDDDASLRGSVTYEVGDDELIAPIGVAWDAASSDGD